MQRVVQDISLNEEIHLLNQVEYLLYSLIPQSQSSEHKLIIWYKLEFKD